MHVYIPVYLAIQARKLLPPAVFVHFFEPTVLNIFFIACFGIVNIFSAQFVSQTSVRLTLSLKSASACRFTKTYFHIIAFLFVSMQVAIYMRQTGLMPTVWNVGRNIFLIRIFTKKISNREIL